MEKSFQNIMSALRYYVPVKYWNLNNWKIIINREEEVEKNIFKYKCSFFTLYFNDKLEPVEYGRQHIIDNKVYYDNSKDGNALGYLFLGYVDWYDKSGWGV